MEYRTSNKYNSPIKDIFDLCRMEEESSACLLLGHRGCGKSTELNKMAGRLAACGYHVKTAHCSMDLDLLRIVYSDLFILMGEALLQIAKELECEIDRNILGQIRNFWTEGTETVMIQELDALSVEGGCLWARKGFWQEFWTCLTKLKQN